jgi:hypothetical protein
MNRTTIEKGPLEQRRMKADRQAYLAVTKFRGRQDEQVMPVLHTVRKRNARVCQTQYRGRRGDIQSFSAAQVNMCWHWLI